MEFLRYLFECLVLGRGGTTVGRVSGVMVFTILIGAVFAGFGSWTMLWALSALASGALMGFLFGIPRVQQASAEDRSEPVDADVETSQHDTLRAVPRYRQTVNTNLEQISDWLTKIIVGVGLVQLGQIPKNFESLARFLAGDQHSPGFVGSVLVFFGVAGFLAGYLLTRLYLARAFSEADQAANMFNEAAKTLPQPPVAVIEGAQEEDVSEVATARQLVKISSRAAVLTAWEQVYALARKVIQKKHPELRLPKLASSLIDLLRDRNLVNEQQAATFRKLRELRNLAAHSADAAIDEGAASDYISSASSLIRELKLVLETTP